MDHTLSEILENYQIDINNPVEAIEKSKDLIFDPFVLNYLKDDIEDRFILNLLWHYRDFTLAYDSLKDLKLGIGQDILSNVGTINTLYEILDKGKFAQFKEVTVKTLRDIKNKETSVASSDSKTNEEHNQSSKDKKSYFDSKENVSDGNTDVNYEDHGSKSGSDIVDTTDTKKYASHNKTIYDSQDQVTHNTQDESIYGKTTTDTKTGSVSNEKRGEDTDVTDATNKKTGSDITEDKGTVKVDKNHNNTTTHTGTQSTDHDATDTDQILSGDLKVTESGGNSKDVKVHTNIARKDVTKDIDTRLTVTDAVDTVDQMSGSSTTPQTGLNDVKDYKYLSAAQRSESKVGKLTKQWYDGGEKQVETEHLGAEQDETTHTRLSDSIRTESDTRVKAHVVDGKDVRTDNLTDHVVGEDHSVETRDLTNKTTYGSQVKDNTTVTHKFGSNSKDIYDTKDSTTLSGSDKVKKTGTDTSAKSGSDTTEHGGSDSTEGKNKTTYGSEDDKNGENHSVDHNESSEKSVGLSDGSVETNGGSNVNSKSTNVDEKNGASNIEETVTTTEVIYGSDLWMNVDDIMNPIWTIFDKHFILVY